MKRSRNFVVPFVSLQSLLANRVIDLIKIDIDSFEYALLTAIEKLVASRSTTVRAILVEIQKYHARRTYGTLQSLHRLQAAHGYTAYRMSHAIYSPTLERWCASAWVTGCDCWGSCTTTSARVHTHAHSSRAREIHAHKRTAHTPERPCTLATWCARRSAKRRMCMCMR